MPSPIPEPTAIRLLKGNPTGKPINSREPKLPVVDLEMPAELQDQAAKDEWTRIVPVLREMRVLTQADRSVLMGYCIAYGIASEARLQLGDLKRMSEQSSGRTMARAEMRILQEALDLMLRFARELGLSPSSRSKVQAQEPNTKDDPWALIAKRA